jgi:hypothetical protein
MGRTRDDKDLTQATGKFEKIFWIPGYCVGHYGASMLHEQSAEACHSKDRSKGCSRLQ